MARTVLALVAACMLSGCAALASEEAIVVCQTADVATTLHAVNLEAREVNPMVDWLLKEFGPGAFVAAKVGVTVLLLHYYPDLPSDLVIAVNGLTCAVAVHNAMVAAELERKKSPDEKKPPGH